MANILAIQKDVAERIRARRREAHVSQSELAGRSGVSMASIRRFEATGAISLASLVRIAAALGYDADFDNLFTRKNYQSLDEVIWTDSLGKPLTKRNIEKIKNAK